MRTADMCRLSRNLGASTFWNPRPFQGCVHQHEFQLYNQNNNALRLDLTGSGQDPVTGYSAQANKRPDSIKSLGVLQLNGKLLAT